MNLLKAAIRNLTPIKVSQAVRHAGVSLGMSPSNHYLERTGRAEIMAKAFTAISFNEISGDYVEFGSHGGMTFDLAYQASRRRNLTCRLWSFDSFNGLPQKSGSIDEHPRWIAGDMKTGLNDFRAICKRNGIPDDDYSVVPGFYETTLNDDLLDLPANIAFAYIDCDLYSSTKSVLDFLSTRMKHGMIIAFDDYFCFTATAPSGERLAMQEFITATPGINFLPYAQFGWAGQSFIIEKVRD